MGERPEAVGDLRAAELDFGGCPVALFGDGCSRTRNHQEGCENQNLESVSAGVHARLLFGRRFSSVVKLIVCLYRRFLWPGAV